MDDVMIARALHVLGVIHWIGGVAFVTLIVLPLAASRATAQEALALFESVERRFSAQVRISIPLVGATGLWMAYRLDLWARFVDPHFWWMGAMLGLWLVFVLIVFVLEPVLHARFEQTARRDPASALHKMIVMHTILLALATVTAFGAVAGAHGLAFF
ncbi:hypothetical protein [Methylovirgula sp. HY1]|uniref:hypothetical protein n=1 Tax=Methylovirgula sp. HY1 TaxID=2822761 RepID=UPI001C5B7A2C|nr:hypothetical protein [Methylovirgula sp. HY1]QXX76611.1 hypothetical protein MHY1_p00133 [Methylovirgula sp. HY1]